MRLRPIPLALSLTDEMRKRLAAMSAVCLAVGSLLYICFRTESLLMFQWADALGVIENVHYMRALTEGIGRRLPRWTIDSLPFSLWVISYMFSIGAVWEGSRLPARLIWLTIVPIMSISSEIAQAVHLVPGTFDWADLGLLASASMIGAVLVKADGLIARNKRKNEKLCISRTANSIHDSGRRKY